MLHAEYGTGRLKPRSLCHLPCLCVTSDNMSEVYAVFHRSIQSLLEAGRLVLHVRRLEGMDAQMAAHGAGFGTESWRWAILSKLRYVVEALHTRVDDGAYVLVSDIDIQYLRPDGLFELVEHMRRDGLQYYGMREGDTDGYNGGMYMLHNCAVVRTMMARVLARAEAEHHPYVDQEIINALLAEGAVRHAKIPAAYCVWGDGRPTDIAVFHHAVCTHGAQDKLRQLRRVRFRHDMLCSMRQHMQPR